MDIWLVLLIVVLVVLIAAALLRWQRGRRSGQVIAEKRGRQRR